MLIGELARVTGLTKDTIRYYTQMGLIKAGQKPAGNKKYADYDEATVALLGHVKLGKSVGFTLSEIKSVTTSVYDGTITDETFKEAFKKRLVQLGKRKQEIEEMEKIVIELLKKFD